VERQSRPQASWCQALRATRTRPALVEAVDQLDQLLEEPKQSSFTSPRRPLGAGGRVLIANFDAPSVTFTTSIVSCHDHSLVLGTVCEMSCDAEKGDGKRTSTGHFARLADPRLLDAVTKDARSRALQGCMMELGSGL